MKKLLSIAIIFGFLFYSSSMQSMTFAAGLDVNAAPIINTATGGSVSKSGSTTNVVVNGGYGGASVYDWKQFNVGKNQTVNFQFNNNYQTALNKVQAAGGMSHIYGKMTQNGAGSATGKVFLLNPNGVFFGEGASVNLNSFTVSSFDGKWNNEKQILELNRNGNKGDIIVGAGAKIHGAEGVNLIGLNVVTHKGSLISTDNSPSTWDNTYGKVKLISGDGVNFQYVTASDSAGKKYSNGAVDSISGLKNTTAKSLISVEGNVTAGSIEMTNTSTHADSYIVLKNSVLKATKAVKGEDGSIALTSNSKISISGSELRTENKDSAAAADTSRAAAINITGAGSVSISNTKIYTASGNRSDAGNVTVKSTGDNAVISASTISSKGNVNIDSSKIASVQDNSNITGNNVTMAGRTTAQTTGSSLTAATGNVTISSSAGNTIVSNTTIKAAKNIVMDANKTASLQNSSTAEANIVSVSGGTLSQISSATATAKNGHVTVKSSTGTAALTNATVNATGGNVSVQSTSGNAVVDNSKVKTSGTAIVDAGNIASIHRNSSLEGAAVSVTAKNTAQVLNGSKLTATTGDVAVKSTSSNVIIEKSTIDAAKYASLNAGKIASVQNQSSITAKDTNLSGATGAQITSSTLTGRNYGGDVTLSSTAGNTIVSGTTIKYAKNVVLNANKAATIQDNSNVTGNVVSLTGNTISQISNSTVTANSGYVTVKSTAGTAAISSSTVNATGGNIGVQSTSGSAVVQNSTLKTNKDVVVDAGNIASIQANSNVEGAKIYATAKNRAQVIGGSRLTSTAGNVEISSTYDNAIVDNARITSSGNTIVKAGNIATIQNGSYVAGNKVYVQGTNRSYTSTDSTVIERL